MKVTHINYNVTILTVIMFELRTSQMRVQWAHPIGMN